MPPLKIQSLIDSLQKDVQHTLAQTRALQELPAKDLLQQPEQGKWSIAQVLEHLNAYNRFYLAVIEKAMQGNRMSMVAEYKPGWLGNYFTKLMQPKEDGTLAKKMSAPKAYNFGPVLDAEKVVQEFIIGQQKLETLLQKAGKVDLGRVKTPISISSVIKLKLGDTLRFLVAHQMRHFLQINRVKQQVVKNHAA